MATTTTISSTSGALTVSFKLGADGGSPVTSETASCTSSDGGSAGSATHSGGPATKIAVASLTKGKTYRCTVTASNAAGTSPVSAPSSAVVVGALTSGTGTVTTVSDPNGITVTLPVSVGRHFTVAFTNPQLTNAGNPGGQMQAYVYAANGQQLGQTVYFSNGATVDIDATPTTGQGGIATVIVRGYSPQTTIGTFTTTYATDLRPGNNTAASHARLW